MDLVVGSRDQTAKVYFNDGTGAPYYCSVELTHTPRPTPESEP